MLDAENLQKVGSYDRDLGWNVVVALALGLLLGALVSMPYDRMFGLAGSPIATVRCLASLVIFTRLASGSPAEADPAGRSTEEQARRLSALPERWALSWPIVQAVRSISSVCERAAGNVGQVWRVLRAAWGEQRSSLERFCLTAWRDARS